ncbi:expressed unknown protein [Seminavis robusta]|uniref:CRAL-TRIO domain-containing protein n=1 Tax=Seminavis robusta TaxID=568900 RepID=A0A9N8EEW5_9STRA|nr:expressed unknown protein [Seminavis robusta]|eukprot:Sro899_g217750.1 n/a (281) ;mRNA; r:35730-36572
MPPKDDDDLMTRSETEPESFNSSDNNDDHPIEYTAEELDAIRQVKTMLMEEHGIEESRIGLTFLAVATINTKLRVEEAVKKMVKFLELMEGLGCPDGISDDVWKPEAVSELAAYEPCGPNYDGTACIWINGGGRKVSKEQERNHVHACIMHFLAVHADSNSLRNGITMVMDVSVSPQGPKIGNEGQIQAFYQGFPQRPQSILIAGTNIVTRVIVNASIKLASLFTKQKVLDRIEFVSVEQAKGKIPLRSVPKYVGGLGGDIDSTEEWVHARLQKLPKPEL